MIAAVISVVALINAGGTANYWATGLVLLIILIMDFSIWSLTGFVMPILYTI